MKKQISLVNFRPEHRFALSVEADGVPAHRGRVDRQRVAHLTRVLIHHSLDPAQPVRRDVPRPEDELHGHGQAQRVRNVGHLGLGPNHVVIVVESVIDRVVAAVLREYGVEVIQGGFLRRADLMTDHLFGQTIVQPDSGGRFAGEKDPSQVPGAFLPQFGFAQTEHELIEHQETLILVASGSYTLITLY